MHACKLNYHLTAEMFLLLAKHFRADTGVSKVRALYHVHRLHPDEARLCGLERNLRVTTEDFPHIRTGCSAPSSRPETHKTRFMADANTCASK